MENPFKDNVDILNNEIEKLLNPDLKDVLPSEVFLNLIDQKREALIDQKTQEFIQENLKFFIVPDKFEIPEYEELDQEQFKSSIEYYKNNPENLVPNLLLLKTANDEEKISKLRNFLNNKYVKAKSTVETFLNVIIDGQKYLKSLELDISIIEQDLQDKLSIIKEAINDFEVEKVKNINLLCKKVDKFLNISSLALVFEEYYNNYVSLELEAKEVLGDLGIEWSFDIN
ncbi:MAG TPA: hypothetical protein LFV91_05505 [Rickettsia endosymbiont of Bembidion nr. Transversale]|nr:hypothetical protein [Rickettsia endosymbiont of Bembidion nr. Transversale]